MRGRQRDVRSRASAPALAAGEALGAIDDAGLEAVAVGLLSVLTARSLPARSEARTGFSNRICLIGRLSEERQRNPTDRSPHTGDHDRPCGVLYLLGAALYPLLAVIQSPGVVAGAVAASGLWAVVMHRLLRSGVGQSSREEGPEDRWHVLAARSLQGTSYVDRR